MDLVSSKDEFQVALVKICIACLDATNFVGLANEVAFVQGGGTLARITRLFNDDGPQSRRLQDTTVRLGRSEVILQEPVLSASGGLRRRRIQNGGRSRSGTPAPASMQLSSRDRKRSKGMAETGLAREIKHVAPLQNGRDAGVMPGVGGYWIDAFQRPEVRRLVRTLIVFLRGMSMWVKGLYPPWRRRRQVVEAGVDEMMALVDSPTHHG